MAINYPQIKHFISIKPSAKSVASAVRRAGFEISRVREYREELWGFYLKPNRTLRELFGVSQEVLLWCSEFQDFQAKALKQAQDIIRDEKPRLSDDLAIIVTSDNETANRVAELTHQTKQEFVGFSFQQMAEFSKSNDQELTLAIQRQFFTKDLYHVTNAITTRRAFFGREALVQQIRDILIGGTSHAALFGIRKMGKTSFLFRLLDELSPSPNTAVVHLDMQRIDAIRPTSEYFLWALSQYAFSANVELRTVSGMRLFGQHARFPESLSTETLLEDFDHDIELIFSQTAIKLIVMIDEIELMSPETSGSLWGTSYVRSWRLLRGLDQTYPGRLKFFITGTNPRCIEVNQLGPHENPTYNYFTVHYLKPLNISESESLLLSIGKRMGLSWEGESVSRAHHLVGGHPLLLRQLGSEVHLSTTPRKQTTSITADMIQKLVSKFTDRVSSSLSQMIEVLGDSYPDELFLLKTLSGGQLREFIEYAGEMPNEVSHLRGYGLLHGDPPNEKIAVEVLQSWLQKRKTSMEISQKGRNAIQAGDIIDKFRIEGELGATGGFGRVYKARRGEQFDFVALKVFHNASLEQLEREVNVLGEVNHKCIVRILDHGKLSTGHVFIAMEMIDGVPLKSFCSRAHRLAPQHGYSILSQLLEALVAIHPNEKRAMELREKDTLSNDEYYELNQVIQGFVHRDIKPDNVICRGNNEPVLIDFGISSRVNTDVVTRSGTMGYQPPDGHSVRWTPDIDLYALGLTMAQCLVGMTLVGDQVEDLRIAVTQENLGALGEVVLKLCAASQAERFESAADALEELRRCLT